jgi:PilZ domain
VLFRFPGETNWKEGMTRDISSSGMLLASKEMLPLGAEMELCLRLLKPSPQVPLPADIVCSAQVVRLAPSGDSDGLPLMAAKILQYRFAPAQA